MIYTVHPEAAAEHKTQVAWYEQQQAGLGARYHADFRDAVSTACAGPHRYKMAVSPDIRRIGFTVFPFDLIYRESIDSVEVLAVAPHRRRPGYWLDRM